MGQETSVFIRFPHNSSTWVLGLESRIPLRLAELEHCSSHLIKRIMVSHGLGFCRVLLFGVLGFRV